MLQPSTLRFLKQLKKNNTKEWFDKNRDAYDSSKMDFAVFVDALIRQHGKKDPAIAALDAKQCTFRINRDVRFSKNKAPYKSNMGASLASGGKKSILAGYYLHLEPGASFAGGGSWMPMPPELKKIRQEIDYNWAEFKSLITAKSFVSVYGKLDDSPEYKLARPPKGYEVDNPAIEFLKLKSFIAMVPLSDEDLTGKQAEKKVLKAFESLQPLLYFINRAISDSE